MNKINLKTVAMSVLAVFATGCTNNDVQQLENEETTTLEQSGEVDASLVDVIQATYPQARGFTNSGQTSVDVSTGTVTYEIVSFSCGVEDSEEESRAWFENKQWSMFEETSKLTLLPEAVQTAFSTSEYAEATICKVVILRRHNLETKYLIKVKQDGIVTDLFYSATGVLLETIADAEDNDNSGSLPPVYEVDYSDVTSHISSHYPNAVIMDIDHETELIAVVFLHDNLVKKALFDTTNQWQYTKWNVNTTDVPTTVSQSLSSSIYASYTIKEIAYYELASGESYYMYELKLINKIYVKITPEGAISIDDETAVDNSAGVNSTALDYIKLNYENALVKSFENEDGYYRVKILHNSIEKKIYFNQLSFSWVKTKYDVTWNDLPSIVIAAIQNSAYAAYEKFEDGEYLATSTSAYYTIKLENENTGKNVKMEISETGEILSAK